MGMNSSRAVSSGRMLRHPDEPSEPAPQKVCANQQCDANLHPLIFKLKGTDALKQRHARAGDENGNEMENSGTEMQRMEKHVCDNL